MNTPSITKFVQLVENSSLLSDVQKREFLENPEIFPDTYRERIGEILTRFEEGNTKRYRNIHAVMEEKATSFERDVLDEDVSEEERESRLNAFRSALPKFSMSSDA